MAATALLPAWSAHTAQLWGHQPIKLPHTLHSSPLFSRDALIELIETYPRSHYALVHMGEQKDRRQWREGEIGGLKGAQVFEAIQKGRMWLNLRDVSNLDARYKAVLDEMFEQLAQRLPGFNAPRRSCGILISSPKAQVYYHADLPGQLLCQIEGTKRVFLYPATKPFISPENIEDIALFDMELDVPYEPWYDAHAHMHTLNPGEFLQWPLNAPHRVENDDCLNVSMTISFATEQIRRAQTVNLANGILRHRFGMQRPSRALSGVSYWSKLLLQKALRETKWVKSERAARRQIAFKLDARNLGAIQEVMPQAAE
jgi:Cupin-like domain